MFQDRKHRLLQIHGRLALHPGGDEGQVSCPANPLRARGGVCRQPRTSLYGAGHGSHDRRPARVRGSVGQRDADLEQARASRYQHSPRHVQQDRSLAEELRLLVLMMCNYIYIIIIIMRRCSCTNVRRTLSL